ncbi:MAG: aspartate/glutamate racemase family protein [Anaerolineales bacterium]|nr:aspartate/glutamate racemase family protein [Anaerolineales bacterium]
MDDLPLIGIVGGVGPFAGLDLQQKLAQETLAGRDQDHLAVLSLSAPAPIPDRTAYLLGEVATNPGGPLADQLLLLERAGACVAGIPCNTAHAPAIWDVIQARLRAAGSRLRLLHMMQEVACFLQAHAPGVTRVGLLATTGTARAGIYPAALAPAGYSVLLPDDDMQTRLVHTAVYAPDDGIKARGAATPRARADLLTAAAALQAQGAQAIILGCTEIPLALPERTLDGLPLIDATRVLARALIRAVDAAKLRPYS